MIYTLYRYRILLLLLRNNTNVSVSYVCICCSHRVSQLDEEDFGGTIDFNEDGNMLNGVLDEFLQVGTTVTTLFVM